MTVDKQKIYVSVSADREQMAAILFKNGYTVKLAKEKNGKRTVLAIEYWRDNDAEN